MEKDIEVYEPTFKITEEILKDKEGFSDYLEELIQKDEAWVLKSRNFLAFLQYNDFSLSSIPCLQKTLFSLNDFGLCGRSKKYPKYYLVLIDNTWCLGQLTEKRGDLKLSISWEEKIKLDVLVKFSKPTDVIDFFLTNLAKQDLTCINGNLLKRLMTLGIVEEVVSLTLKNEVLK